MKRVLLFAVMVLIPSALTASDLDGLMTKLKSSQIDTLLYDEKDFNIPLQEVIETKDNESQLASAYRSLRKDDVYLKHTLLIVLIKKQTRDLYSVDGRMKAKAVLMDALGDDHFWIRKDAVWGLRFFGDTSDQLRRNIRLMILDKSDHVRKEAVKTYVELSELQMDIMDNVF